MSARTGSAGFVDLPSDAGGWGLRSVLAVAAALLTARSFPSTAEWTTRPLSARLPIQLEGASLMWLAWNEAEDGALGGKVFRQVALGVARQIQQGSGAKVVGGDRKVVAGRTEAAQSALHGEQSTFEGQAALGVLERGLR